MLEKILLIQPNMKVATSMQRIVYPPLGLMYIAAVLEKEYRVKILDCQTEGLDRPAIFTNGHIEVGIPIEEVAYIIKDFNPDLVGISCNISVLVPSMNEISNKIKTIFPESIVVAGGNHPSCMPLEVMENKNIDYIIRGEGEIAFPQLLEAIKKGGDFEAVNGLVYRRDNEIKVNPPGKVIEDLDSLPYPAWHLFPYEKYNRYYQPHTVAWGKPQAMPSILTSRGCPGTCVFCSSHTVMGRRFRSRKLEYVFEEIKFLKDKYDIKHLMVLDDNFTCNKARAKEFCDEFKQLNPGIDIHFLVLAAWCMDEELIDKLHAIGCNHMGFALESGVQRVVTEIIKKPLNLNRAMELISYARSKGIHVTGTFVIGFPGETKRDINRTFYMANYSGLFDNREFYIATPLPGSELFDTCKKENLFAEEFSYENLEVVKANIKTKDFSSDYIEIMLEADRTHHLIKHNPKNIFKYITGVWKRKPAYFLSVLAMTLLMFLKYDFLKIKEEYP